MVGEVQSDLEAMVVVGEERKASGLERKQTTGKRRVVGRREWSLRREGVRRGRLVGREGDEHIESQLELLAASSSSSKRKERKEGTRSESSPKLTRAHNCLERLLPPHPSSLPTSSQPQSSASPSPTLP